MCLYELIMAWILEANIMNITKKLLVVAFSIISIIGAYNISNAAGCGTYYIYSTINPKCYNEHCGIWDSTALVQYQYNKRKCVKSDNTTYWDYKTVRKAIDCGC